MKNDAVFVTVRRTFRFNVRPEMVIDEVRALIGGTLEDLDEQKLISNPLLAKKDGVISEVTSINIPSRGVGWAKSTIRYTS